MQIVPIRLLNFFGRIRTGFAAFRDPKSYWGGVQIRGGVETGHSLFVQPDPDMGYIIRPLTYQDGARIQHYLDNEA